MSSTKTKPTDAFVDLRHARLDEQRQLMTKIAEAGHCPFCVENLRKYHKPEILVEGKYWIVTPNQWPYKHTQVHLLAIYKTHAETLSEIDPAAGTELIELMQKMVKKFNVKGGALAMRFGDTAYSSGTVNHIHAQFIEPNLESEGYQPVRFTIGTDPKKK